MQSKLTLIGLYNYDNSLFDNFSMPTGIDSSVAINEILMKSAEFELLYSNADFMRFSIGHWCSKHFKTFEKWIKALNIEYDPLYNYDRTEEYIDTHAGSDIIKEKTKGNSKENNIATSESNTTGSSTPAATTNTSTHEVSAFDSTGYQAKDKTTDQLTINTSASDSSSINSNGVTNNASEHEDERENEHTNNAIIKHNARLYGNIGVTTSQQMLQSELDISRFNIYEQIADLFIDEFCIMVY